MSENCCCHENCVLATLVSRNFHANSFATLRMQFQVKLMLGNENFNQAEILRVHRIATIDRIKKYKGTILAIQDTTSLNYTTHVKTEGIEFIGDKRWESIFIVVWQ